MGLHQDGGYGCLDHSHRAANASIENLDCVVAFTLVDSHLRVEVTEPGPLENNGVGEVCKHYRESDILVEFVGVLAFDVILFVSDENDVGQAKNRKHEQVIEEDPPCNYYL